MSSVLTGNSRTWGWGCLATFAAALPLAGDAAPPPPAAVVQTLMQRELSDLPGKEALMLTVEYPPGGASIPHRHDAHVLVFEGDSYRNPPPARRRRAAETKDARA